MAVKHKCTECGNPLPPNWRPVGTRTVQAVCPDCAVKHMKTISTRRKALAAVGEGAEKPQAEPAR
ncbi:MAG: hypothetical protein KIS92_20165 [Planctomycetota bacterium]|nr:hypothetical protein [Planctomycetota bacterium]